MGGETTPSRAVVQSAGYAYRLSAAVRSGNSSAGRLQHLLLALYAGADSRRWRRRGVQLHHALEQQLCRWLLLSLDRLPANELVMTQELIATMLAAPRGRDGSGRQPAEGPAHHYSPASCTGAGTAPEAYEQRGSRVV